MTPLTTVLVVSGDRLFGEAAAASIVASGWAEAEYVPDGLSALGSIARRQPHAVLVLGDELRRVGVVPFAQQVRRRWPSITVVVVGTAVVPGAVTLPPECTTDDVLSALSSEPRAAAEPAPASDGLSILESLTRRQRLVLRLLADGRDMRGIATELGLSEHTVRTHMQNLYARLGCHSRLELVRFATERGLLREDPGPPSG